MKQEHFIDQGDGWWRARTGWLEDFLMEILPSSCRHYQTRGKSAICCFCSPHVKASLPFFLETVLIVAARHDDPPSLSLCITARQQCCRMTLLELEQEWTLGKLRSR